MERIRYNRVKGAPKDTLVTIADGDTLYFGISRCSPEDKPLKSLGRHIARRRAEEEQIEGVAFSDENTFSVHQSGLRGVCHKARVKELLDYFQNIKANSCNRVLPGNGIPIMGITKKTLEIAGVS